ncbi:MAG: tRNA (adenosine(37)-N6)-threonylcarbamoyltransferase complex transferase subunit TsaD [bacterium]
MFIIGIETSCDETSVAIVKNGIEIVSQCILSQDEVHKPYGGVVPELASRFHLTHINRLADRVFREANLGWKDISAIAVTNGPGLMGALLIGNLTARCYGWVYHKPVVPVHHLEGHICASQLKHPRPEPPFCSLVVSGGHTVLIHVKSWGDYRVMGESLDDAAGEAFDKVAKYTGMGYPGGPIIDRMAKEYTGEIVSFPKPLLPGTHNFSFSGLKTAVINHWDASHTKNREAVVKGFQASVVEVLVKKSMRCAESCGVDTMVIGGGVAANSTLRSSLHKACLKNNIKLFIPPAHLCTDNASMIAAAGYLRYKHKIFKDPYLLEPNLPLTAWKK